MFGEHAAICAAAAPGRQKAAAGAPEGRRSPLLARPLNVCCHATPPDSSLRALRPVENPTFRTVQRQAHPAPMALSERGPAQDDAALGEGGDAGSPHPPLELRRPAAAQAESRPRRRPLPPTATMAASPAPPSCSPLIPSRASAATPAAATAAAARSKLTMIAGKFLSFAVCCKLLQGERS